MTTHKQTQLDAWAEIQVSVPEKRLQVFQAISRAANGATLFELVAHLGWPVNRVSGRVTELEQRGMIVDSGATRVNPESGKRGVVWRAVQR